MKFRVLSVIVSYYVRSPVRIWRSLDVSRLGSIYRPLNLATRELLTFFTKFYIREFHERFLRYCYFTAGQIGLQWILSEHYNKKPGAWGLRIYFTRSSVDYTLIVEPDAEKYFDILWVKLFFIKGHRTQKSSLLF
jgi:hypothetical protein